MAEANFTINVKVYKTMYWYLFIILGEWYLKRNRDKPLMFLVWGNRTVDVITYNSIINNIG